MEWWLVFAIFLYAVCALFLLAEVFVPSGGLLSICAFACVAGGVIVFFRHSTLAGWIGIVIAVIMVPSVLAAAYRVFPYTRFGKSVILQAPKRDAGDAISDSEELKKLSGVEGVVITPLRPVGMCDFDGRRVECVCESGYAAKDQKIKVVRVQSTQVTVQIIQDS